MTRREALMKAALEMMGMPYLWDGKGFAGEPYHGRDCSGFVTSAQLQAGGPDWRDSHNAEGLYDACGQISGPLLAGDLVFYRRSSDGAVHHVMMWLGVGELVFGSAGGDPSVTTLRAAITHVPAAKVQIWESKDFMSGFCGARRLPWLDSLGGA